MVQSVQVDRALSNAPSPNGNSWPSSPDRSTGTAAVAWLLPLHLGTVLTLFLLRPFSKMVHGFFRLAALIIEEQKRKFMREVVTAD